MHSSGEALSKRKRSTSARIARIESGVQVCGRMAGVSPPSFPERTSACGAAFAAFGVRAA